MRGGEGLTDHILSSQQLWIKSSAEGAVSRPGEGARREEPGRFLRIKSTGGARGGL